MMFLCEHPKSGGTWLGGMIADYLQVPFPNRPATPVAMPAVVHTHWSYDPKLPHVVHMARDGRDVMVSFYFHFVRHTQMRNGRCNEGLVRIIRRLFGPDADLNDAYSNLPRFIERHFANPIGAHQSWPNYVRGWLGRPGVVQTTYETLRARPQAELSRVLRELTGNEPDPCRVVATVEKYSMERQTGRSPGEENRASFIRKGVVGDWRNHFSREARELFAHRAGDVLIQLGYEQDQAWVHEEPSAPMTDAQTRVGRSFVAPHRNRSTRGDVNSTGSRRNCNIALTES